MNVEKWLCDIPEGWHKLFMQMCEDISKVADEDFEFVQVKEKYGELRVYCYGTNKDIYNIIDKYEYMSRYVCSKCGKPALFMTKGWIEPYCGICCPDYDVNKLEQFNPILTEYEYNGVKDTPNIIELDCGDEWRRLFEYNNKA